MTGRRTPDNMIRSPRYAWIRTLTVAGSIGLAALPRLGAESHVRFKHLGVEDGLSHTTVWDVLQDHRGFVWISTESSLQRYDGYRFESYQHDPDDPTSLSASDVRWIHEDRRDRLWLATLRRGVNLYDRDADRFVRYATSPDADGELLRDLTDDPEGHLWIASHAGLIRLDPATGETRRYAHQDDDENSLASDFVYSVGVDHAGTLWAGTYEGLDRLDPETGKFTHYRPDPEAEDASANAVMTIYETPDHELWIGTFAGRLYRYDPVTDRLAAGPNAGSWVDDLLMAPDGRLWISTYGSGLYRLEPSSGELEQWLHDPDDGESLSSDRAFQLALDRSGLLWVGTRNGLSLYDPRRSTFHVYRHRADGLGPAGRNVTTFVEDRRGMIWIGFQEGELSLWDPAAGTFETFLEEPEIGSVYALHESRDGELWIGGEQGIGRIDRERRRLELIPEAAAARAIAEDARGILWLGTFGSGLRRFDAARGEIEPIATDEASILVSGAIYSVLVDRAGRVWAGAEEGLSRFHPATGEVRTWRHEPDRSESLADDHVVDLYEDAEGRLWIATYGGGLDRYDGDDGFHHYRERDGLANNNAVGILEDDAGRLWVSTNRGLSRFDPATSEFRNYYGDDGLSSNVFLIGARLRTASGDLVFGGHEGLTRFSPSALADDTVEPAVVITELRIRGEVVEPGTPGSPLERAVTETRELVLSHRQASFSLEFAAPHFANPRENRYAFRLEGSDDAWIETDAAHRRARYTNLDPGLYTFRVRASNQDGIWNEEGATLAVRILPPFWRTWWAYSLYGLALVAGAVGYERWHRHRLERERRINAQLREVDRMKDEFLANTSHELRTPLYGITGLAESLLDGVHGELSEQARADLGMIADSGRRLGALVNDILDYSRLRDRELDLAVKPVDVNAVADLVLTLLRPLATGKNLELTNGVEASLPAVRADENRLQQILLNLVGNAIKFTESGRVEVTAELGEGEVRIAVNDTGIGIDREHLERIFEPFEQVDGATDRRFGGTGLGLAVTRHLVELHGGRLEARSTPDRGSSFIFTLPIAERAAVEDEPGVGRPQIVAPVKTPAAVEAAGRAVGSRDGETILIVDDEPIVRQVVANQLSPLGYCLLQAEGGPEALERLAERPDLVLLDIMMPRMSGFEVCREIRRRHSLEEMPVIYLTARSRIDDLVQGFSSGANDFLSKPIAKDELISRVRTHLELVRLHRNLEGLVEKRTAQVKTLSGLLPVCASCKKIRDDEGYWRELEVYLDAHSEAKLTHGICNDCARQLYPEIDLSAME